MATGSIARLLAVRRYCKHRATIEIHSGPVMLTWPQGRRPRSMLTPGTARLSRDVHETFQAETETRPETQRSETETRPRRWAFCPRRDRDRDVSATETLAETYGEKH